MLSASQFWVLANIVFNAREAKRLFGFIGAGAIAGGIFGGYLTSIFAHIINSENLILISMVLISLCIPLLKYIWKNNVEPTKTKYLRKKRIKEISDHPLKLILSSRHLLLLALIVGVSVIVAKLVDFQFSAIASAKIKNEDELTAFFGFWFSTLNIVSLVIQLLFTRRVVGVFGVGVSLFFLPLGILVGSLAILFFPALWAAVFLKINDGSLKQSINKASIELLALPIPVSIKNQTKSFIDIFVDSFATGIGGIILIFFAGILSFPVQFISLITIALLCLWIYLAVLVRREYVQSFRLQIENNSEETKVIPNLENESVLNGIISVFDTGNEKQILQTLELVKEIHNDKLFDALSKLLNNESDKIKIEALKVLYYYKNESFVEEAKQFIDSPNEDLKTEAFHYLFEHYQGNYISFIKKYLGDEDYKIANAALMAASLETRDNPEIRSLLKLGTVIKNKLDAISTEETKSVADEAMRIACIKAIGNATIISHYNIISDSLAESDPQIVEAAIEAAGQTFDSVFIPRLFQLSKESDYRSQAIAAISNFGPAVVGYLDEFMNDKNASLEEKVNIPRILEKIPTQNSVDKLFKYLDISDIEIRNESIFALANIKRSNAHLKFYTKEIVKTIFDEAKLYIDTLAVLYVQLNFEPDNPQAINHEKIESTKKELIELLEKALDNNLERIFRLLGLRYSPDDMINAFNNLHSNKPDLRINTVEFLDNLLESNLKKVIIPIIESTVVHSISEETIKELDIKLPDEMECFEMLLQGNDSDIKKACLRLIIETKNKNYISLIEKLKNAPNSPIFNLAEQYLSEK